MTGPEHYAEAEWLLAQVTKPSATDPAHRVLLAAALGTGDSPADVIALAQAHFTAAATAATALSVIVTLPADDHLARDWNAAIGFPAPDVAP